MQLPIYQVDAFSGQLFGGNPAAVAPLESWLPDATLQSIAAENNLAETAFFVPNESGYHLRWFTPSLEIDLCGHATLATAHVLFEVLGETAQEITFETRSGPLEVMRQDDWIAMNFPARMPEEDPGKKSFIEEALGAEISWVGKSRDYVAVLPNEAAVAALEPRMDLVVQLDAIGLIATAPGNEADFVSRFFAPQAGVPEDPVTGSAHSTLIPFWADRLGKSTLLAYQISPRGGVLKCQALGERVTMAGQAVLYLQGYIHV